jgi:hypothetical protein
MTSQVMTFDLMLLKKCRRAGAHFVSALPLSFFERQPMVTTEEPTTLKIQLFPVPATQDYALKRLVGAIIGQAAKDARKPDNTGLEARRWLLSLDCADMCEFIGLDFRAVGLWVAVDCPDWTESTETAPSGK